MKRKTLINAVKLSSVYVGTVLGAGFASGQEMLKFFSHYGYKGMFGLVITGFLFGFIGFIVLSICYTQHCTSYKEFINTVAGKMWSQFFGIIVMVFMLICFCAMFAGFGALLKQRFDMPFYLGVTIMAVCCFITFLFDIKGIVALNTLLAPVLLCGSVFLGLYLWVFRDTVAISNFSHMVIVIKDNFMTSTLLYVAYNIITAIVVLCSLTYMLNKRATIRLSAIFAGIALGSIGLVLGMIMLLYYNEVKGLEIPLLAVVMKHNEIIQGIYLTVLFSAILTTAVANGYGLIERLKEQVPILKDQTLSLNLLVIAVAILLSGIGFSTMVGRIYPLFGYFGLFEILLIVLYYFKYIFGKRIKSKEKQKKKSR